MRPLWYQVADEAFEDAVVLADLLGMEDDSAALGGLMKLWRTALSWAAPGTDPDGITVGLQAAQRIASAFRWRGKLSVLIDALLSLDLIEAIPNGYRVKGTDRYAGMAERAAERSASLSARGKKGAQITNEKRWGPSANRQPIVGQPSANRREDLNLNTNQRSSTPARARDDQPGIPHATAYPVDDRPDQWLREEEGIGQFREFPNAETPSPQGVFAVSLKPGDAIPEGFVAQGGTPSQTSAAGRGEVSSTTPGNVFTLHPPAVPGRRERLWAKLQVQREEVRGFKPEPIYRAIVHDRFTGEPVDTLAELMATYPEDEPIEQMHLGYLDTETITVGKGKHQTTTLLACANPGWPWSLFGRNADRYFKPKQAEAEDTSCVHCGGGASCKGWSDEWTCYACLKQAIADLAEAGDEHALSFLQKPHPWGGHRDESEAVHA